MIATEECAAQRGWSMPSNGPSSGPATSRWKALRQSAMIPSSACQPWPPDQPGQAGIVVALGSYTTIRDTTRRLGTLGRACILCSCKDRATSVRYRWVCFTRCPASLLLSRNLDFAAAKILRRCTSCCWLVPMSTVPQGLSATLREKFGLCRMHTFCVHLRCCLAAARLRGERIFAAAKILRWRAL